MIPESQASSKHASHFKCHQRRAKLTIFLSSNCSTDLPDAQKSLLLEQHVDVVDAKRRQLLVRAVQAHEQSAEGDVAFAVPDCQFVTIST
jgi:hypothetical protein